ncbi:hypothetical protein [Massilia glaciei]|uniref:SGNH/GDSL hydrolase family protein n=1 Tax=Massilia glaciei TaxID=1524097 RepID=A0A2U2I576_9BURK|nr:hypothetical protein [Massilia glaciei]PWF54936.1 hypothetical protein C7C56_004435 [Massilia glaciei]
MFGNSHTAANGLPAMLEAMLKAARPGKSVAVVNAPGFLFLDERERDAASLSLFQRQKWSAVVFQAQRYSSSGTVDYSIAEAVNWVALTRARQMVPVMFPEWPRRGIAETPRIFELHISIAALQPACVAPIPQAWDLALSRFSDIVLHASDGNHSSPAGAFLTASILFATMTGNSPLDLPTFPNFGVDDPTQQRLRAVADDQVKLLSPHLYCPNDVRF